MANLINSIIAEQQLKQPNNAVSAPSYTISTKGRVKPLDDKGKLLPSRIFGSPITYAKDLKDDFVSMKNAAKGKANDHQLGRINDVAMKIGSLALATYLFVKNPLKLSKAMEYAGFGTFFASMAIWPKLAIQAPIKARTGVDIHQKYIDSQGRKKMLYQDPQYVLTDLYSREDLDKMGKGLKVDENLPDRDNFIKQRAQKTALQGNTLWMMTAGIATPVMSALGCRTLEKPIANAMEKADLIATEKAVNTPEIFKTTSGLKSKIEEAAFAGFLKRNRNKPLESGSKIMSQLFNELSKGANSAAINDGLKEELDNFARPPKLSIESAKKLISDKVDLTKLSDEAKACLEEAIKNEEFERAGNIAADATGLKGKQRKTLSSGIARTLNSAKKGLRSTKTVGDVSEKLMLLHKTMNQFGKDRKVFDDYVNVRAGGAGSYVANQWDRVTGGFLDGLVGKCKSFFMPKKLKALANGDYEVLSKELDRLAGSKNYDKVVAKMVKMFNDYEATAGDSFVQTVSDRGHEIFSDTSGRLARDDFMRVSKKVSAEAIKDTAENSAIKGAKRDVAGARASFYRLLQSIDLYKKIHDGKFTKELTEFLQDHGQTADSATIERLTKLCKKFLLTATTTDNIEKLRSAGFDVTESEYKTIMTMLYNSNGNSAIADSLLKNNSQDEVKRMLKGFNSYKSEFKDKIVNWKNGMTPELSRRTLESAAQSADAVERNNVVGKSVLELVKDTAGQRLRSNQWLAIFGGIMIALTAVTVGATFAIGRKGKTEKQIEAENKANG